MICNFLLLQTLFIIIIFSLIFLFLKLIKYCYIFKINILIILFKVQFHLYTICFLLLVLMYIYFFNLGITFHLIILLIHQKKDRIFFRKPKIYQVLLIRSYIIYYLFLYFQRGVFQHKIRIIKLRLQKRQLFHQNNIFILFQGPCTLLFLV
mmetsp:Transcript_14667/g.1329  ORF Transcript_14667/g.1329 Transcript_14667/m.1329 type:complete len:151 (-) Transcript_14667:589-1041(-)